MAQRKIIHVDMDAFYASVEQRERPELRGQPVVVAWRGPRSVVCAANYPARRFGIHSAMPAVRAERLCPQAVFIAPDFKRYKAVSRQIHAIFARYTELIEPLSLDEAYLDVTHAKIDLPSATAMARDIRAAIWAETQLTASAGVAPNKFVAKIASDYNKPDGLTVVAPTHVDDFLRDLSVGKIPGVGKVTQKNLAAMGVSTVADLQQVPADALEQRFGRNGRRLHQRAFGVDDSPVRAHRPTRQVSTETTFERDCLLDELAPVIDTLAARTWAAAERKEECVARTVVLKLKTNRFKTLTRSHTPAQPPGSADEVAATARALCQRVGLPAHVRYRLVGVGLAGFVRQDNAGVQPSLF